METRYYQCKKCGEWFEAPPEAHRTVGLSKMEKCPHCGKWAIYQNSEAHVVQQQYDAPIY